MKNFKNSLYIIALLWCVMATACKKSNLPLFLKRDTDAMKFTYAKSTKEFSVLSNGKWKVSSNNDWITFSPSEGFGDGKTEQRIQVTVKQNTGSTRSGEFLLANSEKSLKVSIDQEEGNILLTKPTMASSYIVNEPLVDERIHIPYTKAANGDKAIVVATLQGPGAVGLSIDNMTDYELVAGDGSIPVVISGTPTVTGEISISFEVNVASRNYSTSLSVKGRVKVATGGLDPLESPTINLFKVLPRLAILDWGDYVQNSGESRKFILELANAQYGPAIRRYANQVDWLSATSVSAGMFVEHNRFAFGDLEPNTTYWFRIIRISTNTTKNLNSDVSYFEFKTPAEIPLASNVLLYKDFDNFWWGGSPIYQAFGVQPTEAQILANADPEASNTKLIDYRTMSQTGNLSSTFSGNLAPTKAPLLWNYYWDGARYGTDVTATNYTGWYGVNALVATGAIRLATASAQGYIQTPTLDKIGENPANITAEVNTATYFEPYHSWGEDHLNHYIIVSGGGKIISGGATQVSLDNDEQVVVACKSNVNTSTRGPLNSYTIPTKHTIKIQGATKNTRITIKTMPYSGSSHYRIWVDDIKVTKD